MLTVRLQCWLGDFYNVSQWILKSPPTGGGFLWADRKGWDLLLKWAWRPQRFQSTAILFISKDLRTEISVCNSKMPDKSCDFNYRKCKGYSDDITIRLTGCK